MEDVCLGLMMADIPVKHSGIKLQDDQHRIKNLPSAAEQPDLFRDWCNASWC